MPLLLLLIIAFTAGALATAIARRRTIIRPPSVGAADPQPPNVPALAAALVAVVSLGLVVAALAVLVWRTDGSIGVDTSVANWGDRHATGWSTDGLQIATDLGGVWTVLVAGVLVALYDRRRTANAGAVWFLLIVVLGEKLLNVSLKELLHRARPDLNPIAATLGPSFPSGHSATGAAFWGAVALVALRWVPPARRRFVVGGAVGIAAGVAASRVLLDVHWLTDVVAGLALGWAWFVACTVAFGARLLGLSAARLPTAVAPDASRSSPA